MRTVATILATAFALMPWCSASLFAQQINTSPASEKKVVITKRSTDADGSEVTETIVKKGKAAENFDVDTYIRENRSDKVQVEVRVESDDSGNTSRTRTRIRTNDNDLEDVWEAKIERLNEVWENKIGQISTWGTCNDTGAFLGVEEDSDEDADEEGLVVQIVKGSAAAQAGLKTNDLVLSLNDQKVNQWSDLTRFMSTAKSGEKVRIAYRRSGKTATAEATLTTRKEIKSDPNPPKKGFLGVSDTDEDAEEAGVKVNITKSSAAEKAGLRNGDVIFKLNDADISDWEDISDIISESQSGDKLRVTYERDGKRNTLEATLGEHKSWDWNTWSNTDNQNWDINTQDKKACLGVYTESDTRGDEQGAEISDFTSESAARDATMAEGDLILSINGAKVKGQSDLWNEIAKYNPGDKVQVAYLRGAEKRNLEATLKVCKDNSTQVIINETDDEGDNQSRRFFTWNWDDKAQKEMRTSRVITIHRGEGDASKPAPIAPEERIATDRKLQLQSFRTYPNPTQGQITVEFKAEQVPTVVSLLDLNGRQLFREELNAFDGNYNQQFDLAEYAKGTILIQVQQGDKVYTDQIVVAGN